MKIVKFSINHPVTVFMFTLAALIFGFISYSRLSVNLLPAISYPTLTIKTSYPGTAPSEVENVISKPIEEAVGVVDNVVRVSSVSRAEASEVMVEFNWKTNMDFATLKVREKLDLLRLPLTVDKPIILRYDPNQEPVMKLGITGTPELSRIRFIAETDIKQALESIEGVAACSISGGLEDEIHIDIDEMKLSLLNIPIATVANRLAQENINLSAGILKQKSNQFLVRTVNEFKTVEEIRGIVIENRNGVPIKLGGFADVFRGYKERKVISRIGGRECIEAAIYRAADANTVSVANAVLSKLNLIQAGTLKPLGVEYTLITNQAKFIKTTIDEVVNTAILGGLLAVLALLCFLKNLRATIIIALAIPISVIITFFMMFSLDISLNIISLGGLALGIGMLVDNSIVVLEAIQRFKDQGMDLYNAALSGAGEVASAVTASTLTTVAVFFPIVFVEGIAGQLFRDMALTVTFSLLASLAVSLTLVPMLFAALRRKTSKQRLHNMLSFIFNPLDRFYDACLNTYIRFQETAFKRKKTVILAILLLFLLSIAAFNFMDKELIPVISQGEFLINLEFKPGTTLAQNARVVEQIAKKLESYPQIENLYQLVGKGSRGGITFQEEMENLSELTVRLKPGILGRAEDEVMENVRRDLEPLKDLKMKVYKPRLFSFSAPLEVVVSGNDLPGLKRVSDELLAGMRDVPGLTDLKSSMEEGYPEIQIFFHRPLLASQGLTIATVGAQIRSKVEGDVATRFIESDREVDIRVRVSENSRNRVEKLQNLTVRNGLGVITPLKALADIRVEEGPAEIRRIFQQRAAVITGNLSDIGLDEARKKIINISQNIQKPADFDISLAGQSKELDVAFSSMIFAIALAIFLVYLVMASQFESFTLPFIIMFTIPLGVIGVVAAGLLTGINIDVIVLIGLVILSGIVVNNAIVLVDYASKLRAEGKDPAQAVKEAAVVRWRPILMTTITTVLGLLPMALDFKEGFEIRIPLAVTLMGGLLFGAFLTLVFIPIVFSIAVKKKTAAPAEALEQ